jgi:hypothetical protein
MYGGMPLRCMIVNWQDARNDSGPFAAPNRVQMAVGCSYRIHVTVTRSMMGIVSTRVACTTTCLSALYVVALVGQLESPVHLQLAREYMPWTVA